MKVIFFLHMIVSSLMWTGVVRAEFAKNQKANNLALVVGQNEGQALLAGELAIMEAVAKDRYMRFKTTTLENETATRDNILRKSEALARAAGADGTLMLVFDGWSSGDRILINNNELLQIGDIFAAMRKGREGLGPLQRFVFLFLGFETHETIDEYAHGDFFDEFIGLGVYGAYLVTPREFHFYLQHHASYGGKMRDFAESLRTAAIRDKTRMIFQPATIADEPVKPRD